MSIYVLCVEGLSDGSSNWMGYFRPGINVFTSSSKLVTTLRKYLNDVWHSNTTREDCRKIFEDGGIRIDEYHWIRIIKYGQEYKQDKNPEKLQKDYWYNWDEDDFHRLKDSVISDDDRSEKAVSPQGGVKPKPPNLRNTGKS